MARAFVTTSWDDGHPLDERVAELLSKHDLPACFHIPRGIPENSVVRTLATTLH